MLSASQRRGEIIFEFKIKIATKNKLYLGVLEENYKTIIKKKQNPFNNRKKGFVRSEMSGWSSISLKSYDFLFFPSIRKLQYRFR